MRTLCCLGMLAFVAPSISGGEIAKSVFGKTSGGETVHRYVLKNDAGTEVHLITLGAAVQKWLVPDGGKTINIVLGFDDVAGYEGKGNQYFGCTTGRVAGRIAKGRFALDGKEYKLAINNGPNHLHGGTKRSLEKVVWAAETVPDKNQVIFRYTSPDGEEGYPGNLKMEVAYTLYPKIAMFGIEYRATTDKATPINLTNHSYFNLNGAGTGTILDHKLKIYGDRYVPTDDDLIPTGKLLPVKGTPVDFTKATRIGNRIDAYTKGPFKGYDHTFVLQPLKKGDTSRQAAVLTRGDGKALLRVHTDQPAVQLYTGNHLFGQQGADGKTFPQHSAICLETQGIPDAINQKAFPSVVLRPGETYRHMCSYTFLGSKK